MSSASIARALGGVRNGAGFLCRCPVHGHGAGRGDRSPSLSLADGDAGLLVKCFAGCDPRDVLAELRRRGLVDGRERREAPAKACKPLGPPPDPEPDPRAVALWRTAIPAQGTLVETYLRSRGITIDIPPSIRFKPEIAYLPRVSLPAMIAAVQRADRKVIAVQVTFLDPKGVRKAQVATPRKTIGALGAGAVRLGPADAILERFAFGSTHILRS
jgi:putative DNA primase/helicase